MSPAFGTLIEECEGDLVGPWRGPRQMLAAQTDEGHASIHDDATAQKLGFQGGTIEGPTHFSQFAPLCVARWGEDRLLATMLLNHATMKASYARYDEEHAAPNGEAAHG